MDENNSTNKNKFIIIITIIVVIAIGIAIYFKLKDENCTNYNTDSNSNNSMNYRYPTVDKPIIYLYPEEKMEISIKLGKPENITCSYPEYKNEWRVIADPDGTLIDVYTKRQLYSLYWEGISCDQDSFEDGFIVKGDEVIEFLEEKLEVLGLNEREAEEFIIYWLPELQKNDYNYIRFATMDEINKNMPLEFSVKPDTLIRILMQYKPLDDYIEVEEQKLETPERNGFVVVEWGGTQIK